MTTSIDLSERASEGKKTIGRSVAINGVHAIDMDVKQSSNLNDPIVDINLRLNNPVGRLWLALKRIWKSQNTILSFKFTIPLLVLPIAIYVLYILWQGRAVNLQVSKLGLVHAVNISGESRDILVLPSSDVYLLSYSSSFDDTRRLVEKPMVVIGTYSHLTSTLTVEDMIPYNPSDIIPASSSPVMNLSVWERVIRFIDQFK